MNTNNMLETMKKLAVEAGNISLSYYGKLEEEDITFKNPVNMVTKADKEVEDFLKSHLAAQYPDIYFYGEEGTHGPLSSYEQVFICDPIDGTTNFIHRHPFYGISLAYREEGITKASAIYLPVFDCLYYAEKGAGAFRNGKQVQVSRTDSLLQALTSTGFACVREQIKPDNLPIFSRMIYITRGVRRDGAAALDLAYVADGRFDLFWEVYLYPWDMAGGVLLVEEAGGTVTDIDGGVNFEENKRIVASNGVLHDRFLEELQKVFDPSDLPH